MSSEETRLQEIQSLKAPLESLHHYDIESFRARADFEILGLGEFIPRIERALALFRSLPIVELDHLNYTLARSVRNQAESLVNRLNTISSLRQRGGQDPFQERKRLLDELDAWYEKALPEIIPIHGFLGAVDETATSAKSIASARFSQLSEQIGVWDAKMKEADSKAQQLLSAMEQAAAKSGASAQSIHFANDSRDHDWVAAGWLVIIGGGSLVLLVFAVSTLFIHKLPIFSPSNTYELIQFGLAKLMIFSTLIYGLTIAVKNFLAHRHNSIVSRHRTNALSTYRAIVGAAHSDDKRDILLEKAADCIFGPQPTGFVKEGDGDSGSPAVVNFNAGGIKPN